MTDTRPFLASIILLAGLTGGCGQGPTPAGNSAGNAAATQAVADNAAAPDDANMTAAATADTGSATANMTAAVAPAPAPAATIRNLPLKRGFYVASDTACGQASNATLKLVHRDGINASRTVCEFRKIEKVGPNSYRATEACSDIQSSDPPDVRVVTYTLKADTAFTTKSEHGGERGARYCPQSSLPEPWRDNDISDVTG